MRSGLRDLTFTIEQQIAEGGKVAAFWTATGTHQGEVMGIPAAGKRVNLRGITVSCFANGKSAEAWTPWDALGFLQQLGTMPSPGSG